MDHNNNNATQEGNEMDKYDLSHRKFIQRPFMTLNVFLVGKFHKNIENLSISKEKHVLYQNNDEDPDIFSTKYDKVCVDLFLFLMM